MIKIFETQRIDIGDDGDDGDDGDNGDDGEDLAGRGDSL